MKKYIEREAVLNLLEKINPVDFGSMFDYSAHGAVNECLHDARYGVESLPDADVVEVRHERWMDVESDDGCIVWHCSTCSYPVKIIGGYPIYRYCPMCGARMDKEDEHEAG